MSIIASENTRSYSVNENKVSHEKARNILFAALTDPNNRNLPYNTFESLEYIDDEVLTAALNWLKRQNPRSWVIDTRFFIDVMNRSPMSKALYDAYNYILESYDFESIPRSIYDPTTITQKAADISKALNDFRFYKLAGFRGEAPWSATVSAFCGISCDKKKSLDVSEIEISQSLREQIAEAYNNGYRVFVTCGDVGVGCLAGELVVNTKMSHPDCKLLLVKPTIEHIITEETEKYYRASPEIRKYMEIPDQARKDRAWKLRIDSITKAADMVYFVEYPLWNTPSHYEARDAWIVDHCGKMIIPRFE